MDARGRDEFELTRPAADEFAERHGSKGNRLESSYFAYGSNLSVEQMFARLGQWDSGNHRAQSRFAGKLPARVSITGPVEPAFANVLSPGDGVFGVVYRLSAAALQRLDVYEQGYQRRSVELTDCQGDVLSAEVYVMSPAAVAGAGRPTPPTWKRSSPGRDSTDCPSPTLVRSWPLPPHGPSDRKS